VTDSEFHDQFIDRNDRWENKKKRKLEKLKLQIATHENLARQEEIEKEKNRYKNLKYKNLNNEVKIQDRVNVTLDNKYNKVQNLKRKLEDDKQKAIDEECTFAPKINKNSQYLKHKVKLNEQELINEQERSVGDLLKWGQNRDQRLAQKKLVDHSGHIESYNFKPQISQKSRQINEANLHCIQEVHSRLYDEGKKRTKSPIIQDNFNYKPQINKKSRQIAEKNKKVEKLKPKEILPILEENVTKPVENSPETMDDKFAKIFAETFDKVNNNMLQAKTPMSIPSGSNFNFAENRDTNDLLTLNYKPDKNESFFINMNSDQIIN